MLRLTKEMMTKIQSILQSTFEMEVGARNIREARLMYGSPVFTPSIGSDMGSTFRVAKLKGVVDIYLTDYCQ